MNNLERQVNYCFDGPLFAEKVDMLRHSFIGERFNLEKVAELPAKGFERLKVLKRYHDLIEPKVAQTTLEELAKEISIKTKDF